MHSQSSSHKISSRLILWLTYVLYFMFAPALIGFGINYFASKDYDKSGKLMGSVQQQNKDLLFSHHQWLMRTFVFVSTFIMIGIGTAYLGIGYVIVVLALAWWFFRVIKGMLAFAHHKCMPA